ncbi:MAG: GNAT family protein [Pseudomonadota bacterium]|nr:GNAT family protein [Pseudomonadota bacterium]
MILSELEKINIDLSGEKCRLRLFEAKHLEDPSYLAWLRDPEVVKNLNLPHYLETNVSFSQISAYCHSIWSSPDDIFYALHLASDDTFIGTVKAGHINWYAGTADLGILIGLRKMWGKGIASEALSLLASHLFEKAKLRRLTAGVMDTNPAMIRVFEKLGFQREGTFRQQDRLGDAYIDHIHLGCLKHEFVEKQTR